MGAGVEAGDDASSPLNGYVSRFFSYLRTPAGGGLRRLVNTNVNRPAFDETSESLLNGRQLSQFDQVATAGDNSVAFGPLRRRLGAGDYRLTSLATAHGNSDQATTPFEIVR
jgi:hypothetical protein